MRVPLKQGFKIACPYLDYMNRQRAQVVKFLGLSRRLQRFRELEYRGNGCELNRVSEDEARPEGLAISATWVTRSRTLLG